MAAKAGPLLAGVIAAAATVASLQALAPGEVGRPPFWPITHSNGVDGSCGDPPSSLTHMVRGRGVEAPIVQGEIVDVAGAEDESRGRVVVVVRVDRILAGTLPEDHRSRVEVRVPTHHHDTHASLRRAALDAGPAVWFLTDWPARHRGVTAEGDGFYEGAAVFTREPGEPLRAPVQPPCGRHYLVLTLTEATTVEELAAAIREAAD